MIQKPDEQPQPRPGEEFAPFPRERLESSVAANFERQAAATPQSIAVKAGEDCLTYAALNRAANRVARELLARKLNLAHPVALLFDHQVEMITAMLGVLKAGGWYAPLNQAHPAARNTDLLRDMRAEIILTDLGGSEIAKTYGFTGEQIFRVDDPALTSAAGVENLQREIKPGDPACLLYTSGSTGRPKGVVLDQQAVLHRVLVYTHAYAIGAGDRLALLQSYVFNASVREIYAGLLNGAGLYLYSLARDGLHPLAGWLQQEKITVLYMVPTIWRHFLDTLKDERFDDLRVVRLGGEAVLARDLAGFKRHFGAGCVLANALAATETGTICQSFSDQLSQPVADRVPVGYAVQDKQLTLLDENGQAVAEGAIGEIVVTSAYLGPGYYPVEAQAAAQVRTVRTGDLAYQLPDGRLMWVGRKDWQIKLRGQRINLLEIEQALLSLDSVVAAAVLLQPGEDGNDFLVAYIQPKRQPAPLPEELRRGLRERLPEAMLPTAFVFLDKFPLMTGGKVDRLALPAAQRGLEVGSIHVVEEPKTPTEQALAEIWCNLLGLSQVSKEARFFDLGGNSLLATILMARIEARFHRKLTPSTLFQYETLAELAEQIASESGAGQPGPLISIQHYGEQPPLYFIPGIGGEVLVLRELAAHLGRTRPLYGLEGVAFVEPGRPIKTVEQAAEEYGSIIRANQPQGPYILVGYSFGGHLALETARRLKDLGADEPLVVLIDTFPPVPPRNTTWLRRLQIQFEIFRRLRGLPALLGYLRERWRRIYLRMARHQPVMATAKILASQIQSPITASQVALAVYHPKPYLGRVVLFKASQREWYVDWDPMDGWKDIITGPLEQRTLSGNHDSLIHDPHAAELARQLLEVLKQ